MTEQSQTPPAPPQTPREPKNGLGTAGFVLGLIGLIFAPIPIVGVVAWPLVILGLIFSLVGFMRTRSGKATNKGLSIAGAILSVIGLVLCIVWVAAFSKVASDTVKESNTAVKITYEVTGDATNVDVTYTTLGKHMSTNETTVKELPWSKEAKVKGLAKGGTLTVSTGEDGGEVNCKVTVGDEKPITGSASGSFATANCSGF